MRTLILSCNTGEGHNSCAKAIQETYAAHGETCDIVDALQFISKRASQFISDWHSRIYIKPAITPQKNVLRFSEKALPFTAISPPVRKSCIILFWTAGMTTSSAPMYFPHWRLPLC